MRNDKPQPVCGFQGVSEYSWRGQRYGVRSSAMDWRPGVWTYTEAEYKRQVVATVGTIMNESGSRHEFPPEELAVWFPGYVRARFSRTWDVEYATGTAPETIHSTVYKSTLSRPWHDEMRGHGWAV